jgi:hypothetical protein
MTVKFNLLRPKDKAGKLKSEPVSITVTVCNKGSRRGPFATGLTIVPKFWNGNEARMTLADALTFNSKLEALKKRIFKNWESDRCAVGDKLKGLVEKAIEGEDQPPLQLTEEHPFQKKTSLFTVGRFLAQCKRELDPKTVTRYKVVWKALSRFQKGKRLDFSTMDNLFLDRFKNYLYDIPNALYTGYHLEWNSHDRVYVVAPGTVRGKHIGLFDETVFKYIVILKTICDWCEGRGYVVNPSYKAWQIIKREYSPIFWSQDELTAIESQRALGMITVDVPHKYGKPSQIKINLELCQDYITFATRTGPRISDAKRFEPHQIQDNVWTITQQKGNRTKIKTVEIPLKGFCAPALLILKKYNYNLPMMPEQHLNLGIKEVCKRAGITQQFFIERWAGNKKIRIPGPRYEFFSTHTCKKTCISHLVAEGVPTAVVSQITATSERTIKKHYQGKIAIDKVTEYLEQAGGGKTQLMKVV